jgi:nicotinamidase/pyrazinamidase
MQQSRPRPCTRPGAGDALVVVDVQRDFLPGGSLAVPDGDAVVPVLNRCMARFHRIGLPVLATRDWHPTYHSSFKPHGGPWPPHCIAESEGAKFAPGLRLPEGAQVVSKATTPGLNAYSGFEDTDLEARLRGLGVKRVFVGGLATDYCVLNTVLDALRLGFRVCLLEDAIRAVDVRPGEGAAALARMRAAGATGVRSEDLAAHEPERAAVAG